MTLHESIVKDASLEWFLLRPALRGYVGQVVEHSRLVRSRIPAFASGHLPRAPVPGGIWGKCEATRRLTSAGPAISFRTLATLRNTLLPKLFGG